MKVTLYNAISLDGFIATPEGNSDWVSEFDAPHFQEEIKKSKCVVIGSKTFNQFEGEIFPIKEVLNIVMTKSSTIESNYENVIITNSTPQAVIKLAEEKGFSSILLVGGGHVNGSWLSQGLIDEIIVDIHPLVLGKGIKLFESEAVFQNYEKVSLEELEQGLVLIKYIKK